MRFCEFEGCGLPVWGTDKISRKGYCKRHQSLREDFDKRSIMQKAVAKRQAGINTKVRNLGSENKLVPNTAKLEFEKKEQWFNAIRRKLTGKCQCGCTQTSSKYDDKNFRASCCHLFPKRIFKSIQYHLDNYVERAFFGGCHTQFDESGMDKWPTMADWELIKEKFHLLAPLLTDEERANKFYSNFEKLIYG